MLGEIVQKGDLCPEESELSVSTLDFKGIFGSGPSFFESFFDVREIGDSNMFNVRRRMVGFIVLFVVQPYLNRE